MSKTVLMGFGGSALTLLLVGSAAQAAPAATFAPDGTAHIVDLTVPIPTTLSSQAQAMLRADAAAGEPSRGPILSLAQMRAIDDARQEKTTQELLRMFQVRVEKKTLAGVPVALITPVQARADRKDRLLINLHGGAFFLGKGSITQAIPIAAKSGIAVLAIDYRLAPETPFRARWMTPLRSIASC